MSEPPPNHSYTVMIYGESGGKSVRQTRIVDSYALQLAVVEAAMMLGRQTYDFRPMGYEATETPESIERHRRLDEGRYHAW